MERLKKRVSIGERLFATLAVVGYTPTAEAFKFAMAPARFDGCTHQTPHPLTSTPDPLSLFPTGTPHPCLQANHLEQGRHSLMFPHVFRAL